MQKGYSEVYNLSGGYKTYEAANHLADNEDLLEEEITEGFHNIHSGDDGDKAYKRYDDLPIRIEINACGLQCPGPIVKLKEGIDKLSEGEALTILATDPGFINDLHSWCRVTGNEMVSLDKDNNTISAIIRKKMSFAEKKTLKPDSHDWSGGFSATKLAEEQGTVSSGTNKTLIVFSDDMDRALASFVIANGAAAMGRDVTMFFTFWGLNVIKKENKPKAKRDFMGFMFGKMMPAHSQKLRLSKMNMMGIGSKLMRSRMKSKQIDSLQQMVQTAIKSGVRLIACQMSMDVMGVVKEDLIDGIEIGGVATYLEEAEKANVNLFI